MPLVSGNNWGNNVAVEGFNAGPDTDTNSSFNEIGPAYFQTLGIPMLAGRDFTRADVLGSPKVAAVAGVTAKEALSQPLFYVLMALGIFAILVFPFVPHFTFGEDIKMFKAEGLTLIKLLTVIMAVWSASVAIANGRHAHAIPWALERKIGTYFPPQKRKSSNGN